MPPQFIFARKKFQPFMINGGPTGFTGTASGSGWSQETDFHHVSPALCEAHPCITGHLDNNPSHLSTQGIDFCKAHRAVLLSFIPLYFTDCNFLPRERLSSNVIKLTYNLEKLQLTWEKTFLYYLDDGGDALQCCWNENYNNKHWEKLSSQNKLLLSPAKSFFLILLINIIIY